MTGRERRERVSSSDPRTRAEVYGGGGEPRGDDPELGVEYAVALRPVGICTERSRGSSQERWGRF